MNLSYHMIGIRYCGCRTGACYKYVDSSLFLLYLTLTTGTMWLTAYESNKPCVTDGAQRGCLQMSCQCRMESWQPEGADFPCVLTLNSKPSTGLRRKKKTITSRYNKLCVITTHKSQHDCFRRLPTAESPSTLEGITTCSPESVLFLCDFFSPRSHLSMIQTSWSS